MPARISVESRRGCGYRKVGGLYIMSGGIGRPCGRLPLELSICPTCGGGIHPSRSWTWVDPKPLFEPILCLGEQGGNSCDYCPVGPAQLAKNERMGLLWIGTSHYATPADFTKEAERMGVSRRIPALPKGFELGKTWVLIAHRHCFQEDCERCKSSGKINDMTDGLVDCPDCKGVGQKYRPGIFHAFKPSAVEKVVDEDVTEEEVEALEKRGIDAVIVRKEEEQQTLV